MESGLIRCADQYAITPLGTVTSADSDRYYSSFPAFFQPCMIFLRRRNFVSRTYLDDTSNPDDLVFLKKQLTPETPEAILPLSE